MKKSLAASLIALPLLASFSMAHAADPEMQKAVLLTAAEMDSVTAGAPGRAAAWRQNQWGAPARADVIQVNNSPVTIVQIGNNNTAFVISGNFAWIRQ